MRFVDLIYFARSDPIKIGDSFQLVHMPVQLERIQTEGKKKSNG